MRIAQVVPPASAGFGAADAVRALAEALVRRGHQVKVFAAGESSAQRKMGLRTDLVTELEEPEPVATLLHLARAYDRAHEFDLIHNHVGHLALPLAALARTETLTTPPERLDEPGVRQMYAHFPYANLVSLSDCQQVAMLRARWIASIPPAIDFDRLIVRDDPGSYLVWYGRACADLRPDRVIDLALDLGVPVKLGGSIAERDRVWFEAVVRPRLAPNSLVEWVGELSAAEREELLGGALAFVALPDRAEPFPYMAVEAMGCGTPVVALRRGAYGEVVAEGLTGMLVDTAHAACVAVERVGDLCRRTCRETVERRYAPDAIAERYEPVYAQVVQEAAYPLAERLPSSVREIARLQARSR